jgi:uncharacterized protein YukE
VGVYGADVAQLRGTASQLDQAAEQLSRISSTLAGSLASTPWQGADATSFRAQWDTDHARRIADGSARLREAARALRANADDQERTSAAGTGALVGAAAGVAGSAGAAAGAAAGAGGTATGGKGAGASKGAGGPKMVAGAEGEQTLGGVEGRAGLSARFDDKWTAAGAEIHREGDYGLGAKGDAKAAFSLSGAEAKKFEGTVWGDDTEKAGTPLLFAGAEASGKAGAWAEDKLTASYGIASGTAGYEALAGARADASAGLRVGTDGAQAGVSLGGFAGAEDKGTVGVEVAGVSGGVTAGVRAGIGAELSANVDINLHKVKAEFDIGAALGVGFSIKPKIEFSPDEMMSDAQKLFGF